MGKLTEFEQGTILLKCEVSVLVEKYVVMGLKPKGNSLKVSFIKSS